MAASRCMTKRGGDGDGATGQAGGAGGRRRAGGGDGRSLRGRAGRRQRGRRRRARTRAGCAGDLGAACRRADGRRQRGLAMGAGAAPCRGRNPHPQALQFRLRADRARRRVGRSRRDASGAGRRGDQLVHTRDGLCRAGTRLRPDAGQGRPQHRDADAGRWQHSRSGELDRRPERRDDLAQLSGPQQPGGGRAGTRLRALG